MRTSTQPRQQTEQSRAPYAEAVRQLAEYDWLRLHVPGHGGAGANVPGLQAQIGQAALSMDFPMLFSGIDQNSWILNSPGRKTPLQEAQELAAQLWGASRTWFITNGGSGANHIATNVVRGLGTDVLVQRSVHSSVIDGITHVGLQPIFIEGSVDVQLGANHGVTVAQVAQALADNPSAVAVYLVSPSYFGAVSDIAEIARVCHDHQVPLIVDEAWGSHFGLHPQLPANAVRLGADLVISSTHKAAGALTQSAMLHLGHSPFAQELEVLVDRVVRSYQSTSTSAVLLASLDLARQNIAVHGAEKISGALTAASQIREYLAQSSYLRDASADALAFSDAIAYDPLKVVIDVRGTGFTGNQLQHILIRDHRIYCELATPAALLLLIGAVAAPDVPRLLTAFDALPTQPQNPQPPLTLPGRLERVLALDTAFFSATELVSWQNAAGRISADSLAAYPPGIPNVLPGERLSTEAIQFLRDTAASDSGYVRGAADPALDTFRVVVQ